MNVPSTVIVLPAAFQRAPPSLSAKLSERSPSVTVTSLPPPVTCRNPPLMPASLPDPSTSVRVTVELLISIAPPARSAKLSVKVTSVMSSVASWTMTAAPLFSALSMFRSPSSPSALKPVRISPVSAFSPPKNAKPACWSAPSIVTVPPPSIERPSSCESWVPPKKSSARRLSVSVIW